MSNIIAGIKIPDSKMARDATQLVRDTEPDLLFHHSTRVFLFGALTGERKQLKLLAWNLLPPIRLVDQRMASPRSWLCEL